ncbi:uncharacterized protein LOC111103591 [Crassostrea virginica]
MKQLDMLAELPEKMWYVPCMNKQKFNSSILDNCNASSRLCFLFEFLPFVIYHRLVVACINNMGMKPWKSTGSRCIFHTVTILTYKDNTHRVLVAICDNKERTHRDFPYSLEIQINVTKPREIDTRTTSKIQELICQNITALTQGFFSCKRHSHVGYRCTLEPFGRNLESHIIKEEEMTEPEYECSKCSQVHIVNVDSIRRFWKGKTDPMDTKFEKEDKENNPEPNTSNAKIGPYTSSKDKLSQMLFQEMFQEDENIRLLTLMSSPVLQKSITVKGVYRCNEIAVVTSEMVWVSNDRGMMNFDDWTPVKLILSDTEGNTLAQITHPRCYLMGFHTMSKNRDLIYIADNKNIIKLSNDMKTKTTVVTKTDWMPCSVFCSKSSGDVLVGMFDNVPGQNYTCDGLSGSIKGKITRYDQFGLHIQTVEYDHAGQRLFVCPHFITENINGDVIVSERCRLVVTDQAGKYRFSYRGPPLGSILLPLGICTDALSNILVCDGRTNTVQMIDKDGKFLSFLLTEKTPGITCPGCLSYDVNTNFLWVGARDRNTVSVHKYISDQRNMNDGAETDSESVSSAKFDNILVKKL